MPISLIMAAWLEIHELSLIMVWDPLFLHEIEKGVDICFRSFIRKCDFLDHEINST